MLGKLSKYLNTITLQPLQYKLLKYMCHIYSRIGYSKTLFKLEKWFLKVLNRYYSNDLYAYSYPLFRKELIFGSRITCWSFLSQIFIF